MIGLRQLSNNRLELYASGFPLDIAKPYLLEAFRDAYATVVLYEDNIEEYHETGIYSFDASEPATFNYEAFRAPLIEEFNDKLAICTVQSLFTHLEKTVEEKPMEDDPFLNLVFSISTAPPSREILLDWERNLDKRLRRVLYDEKSAEHFQLFPFEVCVVYSHDNYYTSITSEQEDLIRTMFEDIVEQHLAPLTQPPLPPEVVDSLYQHIKNYGAIRLNADRLHNEPSGQPFLLMTYPKQSLGKEKRIAKVWLDQKGTPIGMSDAQLLPRWRYHLKYSDLSLLPMILILVLMSISIASAVYFRILPLGHTL